MKVTLKELCTELREERRGAGELQQQFTKAKAAWEMERAELKCHITQVGAWGGGVWGLGAAHTVSQSLAAGRKYGTAGITMSSHSSRRVSIATGLA